MAKSPGGTFPIKQMQDEEGNPFYPLTTMALICGTEEQKRKLQSVGANIRQIDLSEYLYITYSGDFNLYILNDFIYLYDAHITYTDQAVPFPVDQDLVIARDIPPTFRSKVQIIQCSATSGSSDRVVCWIDTTGKLHAQITPRYIHKDESYTTDYISSITNLDINGLYFRSGMEEDIFNGSGND